MWRDIRQAIRSLLADRTFSVLVVGTLTLAIGINTTIFSATCCSFRTPNGQHFATSVPDSLPRTMPVRSCWLFDSEG